MTARILQRLLRPIPLRRFATEYFNKAPLFVRGSKDKYRFLFRPDEVYERLDEVIDVHAIFPGHWKTKIEPKAIREMLGAGATICITGLECAHPKLLAAAARIRRELGFFGEVSFRAYLSPPGSGVDLHCDARVATTLQLSGSKRWWFSKTSSQKYPARNSPRVDGKNSMLKAPALRGMQSVLLRPGDLLCLPGARDRVIAGRRTAPAPAVALARRPLTRFQGAPV